jgi:hypothetical protein
MRSQSKPTLIKGGRSVHALLLFLWLLLLRGTQETMSKKCDKNLASNSASPPKQEWIEFSGSSTSRMPNRLLQCADEESNLCHYERWLRLMAMGDARQCSGQHNSTTD